MPDCRRHRGAHPEDARLFAENQAASLRTAVREFSWLLSRGYAVDSALKLVGDRHNLTVRQRMAVRRSACPDASLKRRQGTIVPPEQLRGRPLAIDGYNLLITIESALSGGLVLIGRDGCFRDLASIHGTYRKVEETQAALDLIIGFVKPLAPSRVDWYLDRPVSNSGRLKSLIEQMLSTNLQIWHVEVVFRPDAALAEYGGVVATSDSCVLDQCASWVNLAAAIIRERISAAWLLNVQD